MKQEFEIEEYNPIWKKIYLDEKEKLVPIFNNNLSSIHHIGSTAIPNTKAKPEIDILIVIKDDAIISTYYKAIEKLGYAVRGECLENGGTPGRFYFSKDVENRRTHKLHVCQIGHTEILSKLLFVKYLNEHQSAAIEYAKIKTNLSKRYNFGRDIGKYLAGKSEFILNVLDKAQIAYKEMKYVDFIEKD